jgi:UDPglucose 6-dehydrogenase
MKDKIIEIEIIDYDGDVYNLEVEPFHEIKDDQFYIDYDTGIVIHNCHPRDNIALRYLVQQYGLEYDLFDSIMKSREEQAKNIANKLKELHDENELPIVILGESYKPGVSYTDGSYTRLIAHYLNYDWLYYDQIVEPAIYLLGHRGVHNDTIFPEGSIVLDPWRERKNKDTIYYGGKNK